MRAFAATDKFVTDVKQRKLKPCYLLAGDEAFFRKQCREAVLQHLVPADLRDFSLHEFDLAETPLVEVLDAARTPSLIGTARRTPSSGASSSGRTPCRRSRTSTSRDRG